MCLARLNLHQ